MRLDTVINTRLELKPILAPRMIQSMEILQMPIMELRERIEQEKLENPILEDPREMSDPPAEKDDLEPLSDDFSSQDDPGTKELVIDEANGNELDFDRLDAYVRDWGDDGWSEEHRPSRNGIDEAGDRKLDAMQNMPSRPQSLQDYLSDQVAHLELSPEMASLVEFVISYVDDNGFLSVVDEEHPRYVEYMKKIEKLEEDDEPPELDPKDIPRRAPTLEEIAQYYREAEVTPEQVEEALRIIQQLDPPGVGARDLRECLLLQLTPDLPHRDVLRVLISNHLDDIQHNRLPLIQKRTSFDLEQIKEAIEELKRLNPRPGAVFTTEVVPYVVPDIQVEKNEDGEYEIKLLDDWLPSVAINRRYIEMYRQGADPRMREYLQRKIQKAQWLLESIQQRRNTLERVTRAIIERQKAFLDKGPEYIEPLKMQQIADEVRVHVTTVSRAVDDKWIQTPRGIFPLKRFFGGGTTTDSGEEVAWEIIKQKLLEIIDNEDKSDPLSDEALMAKLQEAGYPIKRRTITKYRKMLKIPSSRQRKEWKSTEKDEG